jgi:hypothetical protein
VKGENGDLLVDSHNILNRWKNYFSQLLNVHNVSDVRQIEVHMVEPFEPGPSCLEVEIAIAKLKSINNQVVITFPAELIQAGAKYCCLRSINSLVLFGIWKNCLISGRSPLLYQFTKRVIKLTVIIIVGYHCCLPRLQWGNKASPNCPNYSAVQLVHTMPSVNGNGAVWKQLTDRAGAEKARCYLQAAFIDKLMNLCCGSCVKKTMNCVWRIECNTSSKL